MAKHRDRDDPIADYIEWTNNRYNPGYYLGGNIPPYLRKAKLSPRGRRLPGISLGVSAIIGVAGIIDIGFLTTEFGRVQFIESAATVLLVGWAAVVMFRAGRDKSPRSKQPGTHRR